MSQEQVRLYQVSYSLILDMIFSIMESTAVCKSSSILFTEITHISPDNSKIKLLRNEKFLMKFQVAHEIIAVGLKFRI